MLDFLPGNFPNVRRFKSISDKQTHTGPYWIILLLAGLLLNSCRIPRNTQIKSDYSKAIGQGTAILSQAKQEINTPAISVAVGIDNQVVWAAAIGYQNIENQIPADTTTLFRVGSTSKAITSIALGKLLQENLVGLDDPVQKYLPFFDSSHPPITLRQLASHTSGIRNYKNAEFNSNVEYHSIKESMEVFQHDSLLFQPGTKFSYSTYNYTVLSAVIEQAAKTDFLSYMKKAVFTPLNMRHTVGDEKHKQISKRAQFYNFYKQDSSFRKAIEVNNSNKWAGGGFLSTPSDLVKLGNAFLNNTLLDAKTKQLLTTPQKLENGKVNSLNYALGWKNDSTLLFQKGIKVQQLHHGGSAAGGTSMLILFPAYNLSISMLINRDGYASADLLKYIYPVAEAFIKDKNQAAPISSAP